MSLSVKNICMIGCATAWGVAAGAGIYQIVKNGSNFVKEGRRQKVLCEQKVDSIKNIIIAENPQIEENLKHIERRLSRGNDPQKVINWQHALDSIRVNNLGQQALEEFRQSAAKNIYKTVKSSASKVIR